jgi:hypothetical protein
MNRLQFYRRQLVLMLALVGLVALGSPIAHAEQAPQVAPAISPFLSAASAVAQAPGSVLVTGRNFTPGSRVYVALYDQWGMELYETRWVTASETIYGPNGSQDPATGFSRGGVIAETFGASPTVYRPFGSQDPATSYVPVEAVSEPFGSLCGTTAMVRAWDVGTAAWSNLLDVQAGC